MVGRRPLRRAVLAADDDHPVLHVAVWIPPLVAIGVWCSGVTVGFGGDTPWLGILPTFETGEHLNQVINSGWQSIAEQRVPATPEQGIVLLLVFLMIACALVADAAVSIIESPALVAPPLLTILALPVAVRPDIADPLWYLVTAILFLVILRFGRRPTSTCRARPRWASIVIGGSLLTPTFLPQVQEEPGPIGGGVATGINPLINLGDDLRRGDPVTALTYTTDAGAGLYLRLATLDTLQRPQLVADARRGRPRQRGRGVPAADGPRETRSRASCSPPTSRWATSRDAGCRCRTRVRP